MRERRKEIKDFIIASIHAQHPSVIQAVCSRFGINRRSAYEYLQALIGEGVLVPEGRTKGRRYHLRALSEQHWRVPLERGLDEHALWKATLLPHAAGWGDDVRRLCEHGFKQMAANARDHSGSLDLQIGFRQDAASIDIVLRDRGAGIFEKIRAARGVEDARAAALELCKGGLGEGIFFVSRMFDRFLIDSGGLLLLARASEDGYSTFEARAEGGSGEGTRVMMQLSRQAKRTLGEVLARHDGRTRFSRGHVPLALARAAGDDLISRSQARRALAGLERFEELLLDFEGVPFVGPAFADEIFRVFARERPRLKLSCRGATAEIERAIARAAA